MKKLILACFGSIFALATYAEDTTWAVRGEIGTVGYGVGVSGQLSQDISLTAGYNGGEYSRNVSLEGDRYKLHLKNSTTYLNVEYRPFTDWQYFTAGVTYFDPNYYGERNFANGEHFKLRGKKFQALGDVRVTGKVKYPSKFIPYAGAGVNGRISKHISLFAEAGTYYIGNPRVSVETDGIENIMTNGKRISLQDKNSTQYRYYQEAVDSVKQSIKNEVNHHWIPLAKAGIVFHF